MTRYTHDGYIVCETCDNTGKDSDYDCHHCNGTGHRIPHTTDVVLLLLAVLDRIERVEKQMDRANEVHLNL